MIEKGDSAPNFSLPNQDGQIVNLLDFKGRNIILYFFPKANTTACTKEAIDFQERIDEFKKQKSVMIGISRDSIKKQKNFHEKYQFV